MDCLAQRVKVESVCARYTIEVQVPLLSKASIFDALSYPDTCRPNTLVNHHHDEQASAGPYVAHIVAVFSGKFYVVYIDDFTEVTADRLEVKQVSPKVVSTIKKLATCLQTSAFSANSMSCKSIRRFTISNKTRLLTAERLSAAL